MENLGTWYLVTQLILGTWYLVLEGHRGEFSYMVADLALKSISGGQETGPLFYRSRTITRWCLYCDYIVIALHVTNVVLYVLMRRHMSYAKASSLEIFFQSMLCSQVRQSKETQKFLWRKRHIKFFGGRGVVIVRNPYRALISYWNHQVLIIVPYICLQKVFINI